MKELDSSSHVVLDIRRSNSGGHTHSCGDLDPTGKCHDLLHEEVTLTNWHPVKNLLPKCLQGRSSKFVLKL